MCVEQKHVYTLHMCIDPKHVFTLQALGMCINQKRAYTLQALEMCVEQKHLHTLQTPNKCINPKHVYTLQALGMYIRQKHDANTLHTLYSSSVHNTCMLEYVYVHNRVRAHDSGHDRGYVHSHVRQWLWDFVHSGIFHFEEIEVVAFSSWKFVQFHYI